MWAEGQEMGFTSFPKADKRKAERGSEREPTWKNRFELYDWE